MNMSAHWPVQKKITISGRNYCRQRKTAADSNGYRTVMNIERKEEYEKER